jgi:hypothetical protein
VRLLTCCQNKTHGIINGVRNTLNLNHKAQALQSSPLPLWQQNMHDLFRYYMAHTAPEQIGRSLRTCFLLHITGIKNIPTHFEEMVLQLIAVLELLDEEADRSVR